MRVLISDLLFPADPEPARPRACRTPWQPDHPRARSSAPRPQPDWTGNYEFIDAERVTRHPHRIEPNVLRRYQEAYANHFALWKHAARRHQATLARIACRTRPRIRLPSSAEAAAGQGPRATRNKDKGEYASAEAQKRNNQ